MMGYKKGKRENKIGAKQEARKNRKCSKREQKTFRNQAVGLSETENHSSQKCIWASEMTYHNSVLEFWVPPILGNSLFQISFSRKGFYEILKDLKV